MRIREATAADAAGINAIYNHEVAHSTATFDLEPTTDEVRRRWITDRDPARHPVVVAETDDRVVAWAALVPWSPRAAYDRTAEVSVYVAAEARRRGLARTLLATLIDRARAAGHRVLIARMSLGEGTASRDLHRAAGFTDIGVMHGVGEKFGRVLDVAILELRLD